MLKRILILWLCLFFASPALAAPPFLGGPFGTPYRLPELTIYAAEGAELVTWTDAGWNEDGATWTFADSTLTHVTGNTTAVTATLGASIVAGTTYKVTISGTGGGATATYTLGGVTGTTIAASGAIAITDYITATTTGSLIITPANTCTVALSSVSVTALTDATGDVTVQGNLVVRSPSTFNSSITLNRGQILLPDGSESVPSLAFGNSTGMGISRASASIMQFSVAGAVAGYFNNTSFLVNGIIQAAGGRLVLDTGYTANLYGTDSTNTLSQRNNTNPQTYQLYETYVSGTEYSRAAFAMTSSGLIFASQANTSTLRPAIGFQSEMNGQTLYLKTLTELLTIDAAATTATSIQIPANVIVKAVSVRVTTVIPTAATFTVTGTTSGTVFNTAAISTAATTTNKGNLNCPYNNGAAQTLTITPNVQPADNTGRVRITIHYEDITPPTA